MRKAKILAGLAVAMVAGAQSAPPGAGVAVNESRPLYEAAILLEHRYGVSISYEDAEYKFNDDLDRTRYALPTSRAGILNVDISPPLTSAEPLTVATLLQGLLEQHVRNGNPGQFKLMETAAGLAIVPVSVRNSDGSIIPYHSLLDVRISFPEMERDADATLSLICQAAGDATGKKIGTGPGPGVLKRQFVRVGANNEIARDVLARMLTSVHPYEGPLRISDKGPAFQGYKISWSLLTEWTPGIDAILFLRPVAIEQPGPGGTVQQTPVPR